MINQVQIVSVPVSDQERARAFYVDTLGFELRADNRWGEGMRWVEVAPSGAATSLTLVTWFPSMPPGSLQGLVVSTGDIHATYAELVSGGVQFDSPPTEQPGGVLAVFRDPDGKASSSRRASSRDGVCGGHGRQQASARRRHRCGCGRPTLRVDERLQPQATGRCFGRWQAHTRDRR